MNLEQLGSHFLIEGIRKQDGQKNVNPNSATVNMVEEGKSKSGANNPKKRKFNDFKRNKGYRPKGNGEEPQRSRWVCGKIGHFKKDCTKWKRKGSKKKRDDDSSKTKEKQRMNAHGTSIPECRRTCVKTSHCSRPFPRFAMEITFTWKMILSLKS